MTRVYDVFDKFSILNIVIGFALGFYLVFNNTSNLWFVSIPLIFILGIIMTIPPILDYFLRKGKFNDNTNINALVEAFILNVLMIAVCTAFGIAITSFLH
jgi:ABC-type amino acid transport system permease subunit